MKHKAISLLLKAAIAIFPLTASAADVQVLHNFRGSQDGAFPGYGALILDKSGNLYGTTMEGGDGSNGTVFELTPNESGLWTETVLHHFGSGSGGSGPIGGVVFDTAGNLYGTTVQGGLHDRGTVFELSPVGNGTWTETVLHSFDEGSHGIYPRSTLIFDDAGNLYGTTEVGGAHNNGTVFELSPGEGGKWTETVLHSFYQKVDGTNPEAGVIFDAAGNLYGTTTFGGPLTGGTVFELTPGEEGWTETTLAAFSSTNTEGGAGFPAAGVTFDAAGNLYGTLVEGGANGGGAVFELVPVEGSGIWTKTFLHNFRSSAKGGEFPWGGLIFDQSGKFFGITFGGGVHRSGEIFEFTPDGSGGWTHTVLHDFSETEGDGSFASLVIDAKGNLYGATSGGGTHNGGTVFEVVR